MDLPVSVFLIKNFVRSLEFCGSAARQLGARVGPPATCVGIEQTAVGDIGGSRP